LQSCLCTSSVPIGQLQVEHNPINVSIFDSRSSEMAEQGGVAKTIQPFVVAGFSAMFASACVSPMDVTKTRMQVLAQSAKLAGTAKPTISSVVLTVWRNDGVKGFYAGLTASLMRQAVYGTARIGLHRYFSDWLKKEQGGGELSLLVTRSKCASFGPCVADRRTCGLEDRFFQHDIGRSRVGDRNTVRCCTRAHASG
jgi:hypothetical protein